MDYRTNASNLGALKEYADVGKARYANGTISPFVIVYSELLTNVYHRWFRRPLESYMPLGD